MKKKIEINVEKNYAWCKLNDIPLYGRNKDDIVETLNMVFPTQECEIQEYENE